MNSEGTSMNSTDFQTNKSGSDKYRMKFGLQNVKIMRKTAFTKNFLKFYRKKKWMKLHCFRRKCPSLKSQEEKESGYKNNAALCKYSWIYDQGSLNL